MSRADRNALIAALNPPSLMGASRFIPLDGSATLHELFEAQAARTPDATAITCGDRSLTYRQINAAANCIARRLRAVGVGPDALVGVCMERTEELIMALVGILKAGGAYLPIDPAYPAERLAFMLEDSGAPALLTLSRLRSTLPPTTAQVICVDDLLGSSATDQEQSNLPPSSQPDNLAYVIYTSGTTGRPKGSLTSHRNVVRLFSSTEHWFGFNEHDVWTLFHSCAFDFSVWEIWGALLYGGRLVVVPFATSRAPDDFYRLLSRERVTVLSQTPSAFRMLMAAEESQGVLPLALRYIVFGGEALEMRSLGPWFDRHGDKKPQLVNMYGITETTVHVTYRPIGVGDIERGSVIGVPIPDLQLYVLDSKQQLVPIGVPGELYVGGAGLARGYLNRPDLTAERFIKNPFSEEPGARLYRTGDLARIAGDLEIEYLGRTDTQVKIRGFRIEVEEIEAVLARHPGVRQTLVVARDGSANGQKSLTAYFVPSGTPAPAPDELRAHLAASLPEFMVPTSFVPIPAVPLTPNGKLDYKALPTPQESQVSRAGAHVPPETPTEKVITEIWQEVLGRGQIGIDDDFFELGGDSLCAFRTTTRATQVGLQLTAAQVFGLRTARKIAAAIGGAVGVNCVAIPIVAPKPGITRIDRSSLRRCR
jgi:amino acid adenylation domain-containing protein